MMTDKNAQKIYAAIKKEYRMSNPKIEAMIGCGRSMMSKLKAGKYPGKIAATWLVERHPKYQPLLDKATEVAYQNYKRGCDNRATRRACKTDALPRLWPVPHNRSENVELSQS